MFFPQFARACCSAASYARSESDVGNDEEVSLTMSMRGDVNTMPVAVAPSDATDLIIDRQALPGVSVEQLRQAVAKDTVLKRYLMEFSKATDVSTTKWFEAPDNNSVRFRRARFTMPVPQDVPAAIARLAAVPETSKATIVLGYCETGADELIVLIQQVTHDVPFGNTFRVHEVMVFRSAPGGGSVFSKWTSVKWGDDLPWYASAIKPITESKTKAGSPAGGEAFARILRQNIEGL